MQIANKYIHVLCTDLGFYALPAKEELSPMFPHNSSSHEISTETNAFVQNSMVSIYMYTAAFGLLFGLTFYMLQHHTIMNKKWMLPKLPQIHVNINYLNVIKVVKLQNKLIKVIFFMRQFENFVDMHMMHNMLFIEITTICNCIICCTSV